MIKALKAMGDERAGWLEGAPSEKALLCQEGRNLAIERARSWIPGKQQWELRIANKLLPGGPGVPEEDGEEGERVIKGMGWLEAFFVKEFCKMVDTKPELPVVVRTNHPVETDPRGSAKPQARQGQRTQTRTPQPPKQPPPQPGQQNHPAVFCGPERE